MRINLKLKLRIIALFRTQREFASACGRNDNWISRIVNNIQAPTEKEMELICQKLAIKPEEKALYFLDKEHFKRFECSWQTGLRL